MRLGGIHRRIGDWVSLAAGLLSILGGGCSAGDVTQRVTKAEILASMPLNSDQRCVGIAIVLEALFETDSLEAHASQDVVSVADRLYDRATGGGRVQLSQYIKHDGERVLLVSREGLELLSTSIADRYKRAFGKAIARPTTKLQFEEAYHNLSSSQALEAILTADADQAVVFCGIGEREFPNGDVRETSHAFVLQRQAAGEFLVYDPNDPQCPVACQVDEREDGVVVTWTGNYRDTGFVTTQYYYLVTAKTALKEAFGTDP